ncbi:MAG: DUF6653 family protein [Candidatus Bathyarchaeia archaeon]|jgi:hypothetical protein
MTKEEKIAKLFNLDNKNWMRHANPWSVRTRYSALPLIVIACWTRVWIGYWCILPIALSLAWMFLNPVLFSQPKSTNNWESKSVLGERVYANRNKIAIPQYHKKAPNILNVIAGVGMMLALYGVFVLSVWPTVMGVTLAYLGKSWYLDRMAWLYEDMKKLPEYSAWLY